MVVHLSLSDSKSPLVALFWWSQQYCKQVSILLLISSSSRLLSELSRIVSNVRTTTAMTVTLIFHSVLSSRARSQYLCTFSLSFFFFFFFSLYVPPERQNPQDGEFFFLVNQTFLALVFWLIDFYLWFSDWLISTSDLLTDWFLALILWLIDFYLWFSDWLISSSGLMTGVW